MNFCKKCGEMWWIIFFHRIHRFHRISYINVPQKWMRWNLARNEVNFLRNLVKCGEIFIFTAFTAITAFLTKFTEFTAFFTNIYPKTSTRIEAESALRSPIQLNYNSDIWVLGCEKLNFALKKSVLYCFLNPGQCKEFGWTLAVVMNLLSCQLLRIFYTLKAETRVA